VRGLGDRSASARLGFTLTELVTTLTVVLLLAVMAVPSLSGLAGARENVAAIRVRTVLAFAQEWASASGNATWVAFDTAADRATVYVENPSNPGKANRLAMTDPLTRSAMVLQLGESGVGLESADFGGTVEVHFDSLGRPRDANGVLLSADGTVGITGGGVVRVTRNTGLVTVD
jgi:prepilin-type N-terminal cleavage/methylation domain-containing protein